MKNQRMAITMIVPLAITLVTALSANAHAASPTLLSVDVQDRHPGATFSAPGADDVGLYIASSPERATDGRFLQENIEASDSLTDAEIQSGQWRYEDQLDPGTYYVLVGATDFDCSSSDPACVNDFSAVLTLTVAKPRQKFKAKIRPGYIAEFKLTVSPLGEDLPYKLCWKRSKGRRKCVRAVVEGYDWNEAESDSVYLTVSDLKLGRRQSTTRFIWYVRGKRVASKRVRIER